ncbi:MAG: DUF5691 domain-containing protein [Neisseria sp.]|nr:DUF5691 domain-containing protein [Neisseria sp.]
MLPQNLLNTALIGTARQQPDPADLPAALQALLPQSDDGGENRFYRQALLAAAYHYGGQRLAPDDGTWQPAPAFEGASSDTPAPDAAMKILRQWLNTPRNATLLSYAFKQLSAQGLTIPKAYLDEVLDYRRRSAKTPNRPKVPAAILGGFGRWVLAQTDGEKAAAIIAEEETDWELAGFAERKRWLAETRSKDPQAALAQLEKIWKTAPANHRQDYINILENGLSPTDEAFLTAALKDRSKPVRETAQKLLARLPDSEIARQLLHWLGARLQCRLKDGTRNLAERLKNWPSGTEGIFSGLWQHTDAPYTEEMKAAGIEQISPRKNETDQEYQLFQIIMRIPLSGWAAFMHCSLEEAAEILAKAPPVKKYLDWADWIRAMDHDPAFTAAVVQNRLFDAPSTTVFKNTGQSRNEMAEHLFALPSAVIEKLLLKNGLDKLKTIHPPYTIYYYADDYYDYGTNRDYYKADGGEWGEQQSLLMLHWLNSNRLYIDEDNTPVVFSAKLNSGSEAVARLTDLYAHPLPAAEEQKNDNRAQAQKFKSEIMQKLQQLMRQKREFKDALAAVQTP